MTGISCVKTTWFRHAESQDSVKGFPQSNEMGWIGLNYATRQDLFPRTPFRDDRALKHNLFSPTGPVKPLALGRGPLLHGDGDGVGGGTANGENNFNRVTRGSSCWNLHIDLVKPYKAGQPRKAHRHFNTPNRHSGGFQSDG